MTKLFLFILMVAGSITAQSANPGNDTLFKVMTDESSVGWTARKVTGQHNGSIGISEGTLIIEDGVLKGGSITIDMNSITVLDQSGPGKTKLEGHLKSDDFFGVQTHPTATLTITNAVSKGSGQYTITADLTIKGITHPVSFDAVLTSESKSVIATADIKVDRSLYDVRYGSGKFYENLGDKTIYDEFELTVRLVAGGSTFQK